tara:strand:+ start:148 stop:420 length:273 start_codon:yes stop_codon:yes gene_type:complete
MRACIKTAEIRQREPVIKPLPVSSNSIAIIATRLKTETNVPKIWLLFNLRFRNSIDVNITAIGMLANIIEARPEDIYFSPIIIKLKGIEK